MINNQSTNHHTCQRLSCFVSRCDAFSLSHVINTSIRKTYLWDKRNDPCKNKALFLFPRKNTIRNIYEIFRKSRSASTIWFSSYFQSCFRREKKCGQFSVEKLLWKLFFFSTFVKWLYKASLIICQIFLPVTFPFWKLIFFSGKEEAKLFSPLLIFSLTVEKSHGKWIFHSKSLTKVGGKRAEYF